MRILGIIPARFASTRFPGKPLHLIAGKPLIQHVVERCQGARSLAEIIVATDDPRIAEVARKFFRDAIGAAGVVLGGHLDAAEFPRDLGDARVVGGDDNLCEGARALAALDDVLDEGLARDEVERLARKPARSEACGDDAKDAHGRDLSHRGGECTA